jgi:hypothetical protein
VGSACEHARLERRLALQVESCNHPFSCNGLDFVALLTAETGLLSGTVLKMVSPPIFLGVALFKFV